MCATPVYKSNQVNATLVATISDSPHSPIVARIASRKPILNVPVQANEPRTCFGLMLLTVPTFLYPDSALEVFAISEPGGPGVATTSNATQGSIFSVGRNEHFESLKLSLRPLRHRTKKFLDKRESNREDIAN